MNTKESLIDNYWIKKYESGIINLTFNTKEKWIAFHAYSKNEYEFWTEEGDDYETQKGDRESIKVPELEMNGHYLQTVLQNKDQISFYFIPFNLLK